MDEPADFGGDHVGSLVRPTPVEDDAEPERIITDEDGAFEFSGFELLDGRYRVFAETGLSGRGGDKAHQFEVSCDDEPDDEADTTLVPTRVDAGAGGAAVGRGGLAAGEGALGLALLVVGGLWLLWRLARDASLVGGPMLIYTRNSEYEYDAVDQRIRRITSKHSRSSWPAPDGEWLDAAMVLSDDSEEEQPVVGGVPARS